MINAIIHWSIVNRVLVLILAVAGAGAGVHIIANTPVDAIPDLSDTQVIVRAMYPGQAPEVVESQVTYPLTTALMGVPGAHTVRGYSMFGDSFVYVLFDDGTDPYWARSRVQEYLGQVEGRLPDGVSAALGPDATGVGWVYKYALVDRTGNLDLAELRALQDWFLKFELQAVSGVSEVATMGGMVRQYQVVVDPNRLRAHGIPLSTVRTAIQRGNAEVGGALLELAEAEYMVRATGYIRSLEDLRAVPLGRSATGTPVTLQDVADVRRGPAQRRGITELDGEGEAVGAIVVMRHGENARATIRAVRARIDELSAGLPAGVEIVTTYDRSALIERAIATLWQKLALEFAVVVLICSLFLWHLRSSLVILVSLPLGVLVAFVVMYMQGINANIMSLGGIAIAIGVMVDAAIVLIEYVHKRLARDPPVSDQGHWQVVEETVTEVGRPIFLSLLVVAVGFLPVFALEAQAGRMFTPLALTGTYAMAAAAGLAVTLVPVLIGYLVRGRIRPEMANPVNRGLVFAYRPMITGVMRRPWLALAAAMILLASALYPATQVGTEFMPELDEGDLMYMPTTLPGLSPDKARELLQQTNALIRQTPEVERVFGKAGRADTATDPAPLTMFETFISLKPRDQWRRGLTTSDIIRELDERIQLPGVSNAWVFPIQTRIDMLQTGIRTDVGIGITGPDLLTLQELAQQVASVVNRVPGTATAFADRPAAGRYVVVDIDRAASARHGMNIADVHEIVRYGIGGADVTETVEGLERFPVNVRFSADWRDSPQRLRELPVITPAGTQIALGELARINVAEGAAMIRSENTRPTNFVFADVADRDLGSWVAEARSRVTEEVTLPPGYAIHFTGQYEYLQRARQRLNTLIPLAAAIIIVLLMLTFRRPTDVVMVLLTVPLSLAGGMWLMWWLGHNMSVGVAVGFIALGGLAAQTGIIMVVYLGQALEAHGRMPLAERTRDALRSAITGAALSRVRPATMTESTVFLGLLPILLGTGTGAEIMQRIAAPMVGGVFTVWLVALIVLPAAYYLWHARGLPRAAGAA
ncbi:MAG: efflux RND transporter permease subunit [Gammaproteobacteria bacterium]|nr:efflux RND transporter permease subunit [Gammaproteobacteria bacterium]